MIQYKSYSESARELRQALKQRWPNVTFSVTKSGRNCANVAWVDGPTWEQVNKFCDPFEGADFDPMQDLETPRGNGSGIKYIFPDRKYSGAFLRATLAEMQERYRFETMPVLMKDTVSYYLDFNVMWKPNGWEMDAARRFMNEREG